MLIIGDKQILIIFLDNFLITNYQTIIIIEHCITLYYAVIIIYDYSTYVQSNSNRNISPRQQMY